MSRGRKGLRPLSQTGFIRVPKNPHQRNFEEGGTPVKRTALERINERLDKEDRTLHPTKGFRKSSPERTAVGVLTAEIKNGMAPFSMKLMRRTIATARMI